MKIEMHCHTEASLCSRIKYHQLIQAKDLPVEAICITDHDTYEGYDHLKQFETLLPFKLFMGIEIRSQFGDVLVYSKKKLLLSKFTSYPRNLIEIYDLTKEADGIMIAAHPFRRSAESVHGLCIDERFDGIEVWNGRATNSENREAFQAWHSKNNKGPLQLVGSDAHRFKDIGQACIVASGDAIPINQEGFLNMIKTTHYCMQYMYYPDI